MAKNKNAGANLLSEMFFPQTELAAPEVKTSKQPEIEPKEEKAVAPDKIAEENVPAPTSANKRGKKAKTGASEQSTGKKTLTVYLNAENWAQFCKLATVLKSSASAWLDELIAEELRKNKSTLDFINQIK